MPEGDAIFRTARTLQRALGGQQVVRFESVLPALTRIHEDTPVTGRSVESVTAAGKHILMRFSALRQPQGAPSVSRGGLVLRTHMRMNGSWHIYRPGERWQRPRRDMRLLIATREFEAVGFNVPVAEFLDARQVERRDDLRLMGPDLLGASFDEAEAIRRFRERESHEIADVLLNQRVVAGVGNIYKSEVLFLCRIDPFAPVARVSGDELQRVLATARKYLRANVAHPRGGIVTYTGYRRGGRGAGQRHYVYGRAGKPCRTCGTTIAVRAQGPHARLTYWCPSCQASRVGSRT
ncbi:MAG TPA: DNA-formamidopyrimidine glycosylase family protein [Vicinamibacterales bacterium]|jgi:endonuclease-8|nr:DNA-formamidopyrimidine glycosylase family protein [Vicinamibacterales bacterium]